MARMGHDSVNAALIYQHATSAADQAIVAALDGHLLAMNMGGSDLDEWPVDGPTDADGMTSKQPEDDSKGR